MDIVEFAQSLLGYSLPLWQKELLRRVDQMPKDQKLVWYRRTWHVLKDDKLPENARPVCHGKGYNARVYIVDEAARGE